MTTPETTPRDASPLATSLKAIAKIADIFSKSHRETNTNGDLSVNESLNLLAAARRRAVIEQLAQTNQAHMRVADLAEQAAAVEYDCDLADVSSDERKRVYISMIQSHLPPLDDADVVDYDDRAKTVAPGPQFNAIWQVHVAVLDELS